MQKVSQWPATQRLSVGLSLALVGGFLDTYTFFTRGGVFANAQTGNMVRLSISAAQGQFLQAGQYLIPILAAATGTMLIEGLRVYMEKTRGPESCWQRFLILIEAAILTVIGFLPPEVPNIAVNVTVSFICAMQVNGFRQLEGMPFATTMCTGNLRSCSQRLWRCIFAREPEEGRNAAHYLYVILTFCTGAAVGVPLAVWLGGRAIWFATLTLLWVYFLLGYLHRQSSNR